MTIFLVNYCIEDNIWRCTRSFRQWILSNKFMLQDTCYFRYFHGFFIIFVVMYGQSQYIARQFLCSVAEDRRDNGQAGIAPARRSLLERERERERERDSLYIYIISVLPKGKSFTANAETKVKVLLKGRSSTANSGTT